MTLTCKTPRKTILNVMGLCATLVSILLLGAGAATAACNFSITTPAIEGNGGTNGVSIRLAVPRQINMGTFTRPDSNIAREDVILRPDGTRTLPPTLVIRSDDLNPARSPYAAVVEVTGGANCGFEIVVGNTSARLNAVTLEADAPYVFGTITAVRARGRLDATGRFRFRVGVTQVVRSNNASVGGSIELTANYRNAP